MVKAEKMADTSKDKQAKTCKICLEKADKSSILPCKVCLNPFHTECYKKFLPNAPMDPARFKCFKCELLIKEDKDPLTE